MKFTTILIALVSASVVFSTAAVDLSKTYTTLCVRDLDNKCKRSIEFSDKGCTDCGSPFSTDPCCNGKRTTDAIAKRAIEEADKKCSDCGSPFSTDPCCNGKLAREVEKRAVEEAEKRTIEEANKKCTDCGSPFSTDPCCQRLAKKHPIEGKAIN